MMDEKVSFLKRKKGSCSLFACLLAAAVVFVSCDDFYSTSWGTPRDYDSSKINVNAGNVDRWIADSAGNPELAKALADKIKADLAKAQQGKLTPEQLKLQNAGVKLAIEAAGLGEVLLGNAAGALSKLSDDDEPNEDVIMDILENIQNDFRKTGPAAAGNLAEIAGYSLEDESYSNGGEPQFSTSYANSVKAGDVGLAVVTLALAVIEKKVDDVTEVDLDKLSESDIPISVSGGKATITASNADQEVVVLAAYLNLIASDTSGKFSGNPITSAIRDAFGLAQH